MKSRFFLVMGFFVGLFECFALTACSPVAPLLVPADEIKSAAVIGSSTEIQGAIDAPGIYDHLQLISKAVEAYQEKYQKIPSLATLVESGFLKSEPILDKELGGGTYDISASFDDMDGQGEMDHAIYTTGPFLPAMICNEFNKRYAAPPLNDGTIFDYQAAGNKYPGAVYGREMKIFAIKWKTAEQGCEINWVLEYR